MTKRSRSAKSGGEVVVRLKRRTFLKLSGLSATFSAFELSACHPGGGDGPLNAANPSFSADLLRKEDLVSLHFDFYGLVLSDDGKELLTAEGGDGERLIAVTHAPQHIAEQFLRENVVTVIQAPPLDARVSGPSRVVLRVPSEVIRIAYTPEALLAACGDYAVKVSQNALPPVDPKPPILIPVVVPSPSVGNSALGNIAISGDLVVADNVSRSIAQGRAVAGAAALSRSSGRAATKASLDKAIVSEVAKLSPIFPVEPGPLETSIELPFRLTISPSQHGQWAHASLPFASDYGRVELWHTRLGVRNEHGAADESASSASYRSVRALWTRDLNFNPQNPCSFADPAPAGDFSTSIPARDRIAIVHQSSNYAAKACTPHGTTGDPEAIQLDRLMLTALGGYLTADGEFGDAPSYGLESWKHRATLGRDQYVELVHSGVLYPFGHRASLITITERKFVPGNSLTEHTAFLWQRSFLLVREPVVSYPDELRKFPFTQLHIKTLSTPDLSSPPDLETLEPFMPEVDGKPYQFAAEGLDREGKLTKFTFAAVWLPAEGGSATKKLSTAASAYAALSDEDRRAKLSGQRLAFAKSSRPDDTTYEVVSLTFAGSSDTSEVPEPPQNLGFYPVMSSAAVQVEAVRHLSGQDLPGSFGYAKAYLDSEFSADNAGELLLELLDPSPLGLDFTHKSDRSGGFVTPSLDITGLSRLVGPIAGDLSDANVLGKLVNNEFDPSTFLASGGAKLFGVFELGQVIQSVASAAGGLLQAPQFVTQSLSAIEDLLQNLARIQSFADELKGELEAAEAAIEKALGDVADKAKALVGDIADIDPETIDEGISKVIDEGLPEFIDALSAVADLFDMDPIPEPLQKLSEGPRRAFKQTLDQVKDLLDSVKDDIETALKAFRIGLDVIRNLSVKLDWRPTIQGFPEDAPIFAPNKPDGLVLTVEVRAKDSPGKKAGVDMSCSLEDFELRLIASKVDDSTCVILKFKKIAFSISSGKKPDIDVDFDEIVFDGPLAFVQTLKELIPLKGFSDPPNLDVSTEGIKASFTLALPNVAIGIFSLTNLSFSAGFHIPFLGDPLSVSFYFCTRDNPFHLTVSLLGGGGFFGIEISPAGIEVLEAALEFGAALSVDFGVASGSISAMAGIYFRMEKSDAQLSGYFRLRGEVDVLGIISASIELYMELMYEFSTRKLVGQATLEIEVSIAFFSVSVSLHAERKFAGDNNDPTFEDVMAPAGAYRPWDDYLAAFAA